MSNMQNYYIDMQLKQSLKAPKKAARMPKEEAQSLAQKLKMASVAASIVLFGLFGGIIAPELQRTATQNKTNTTNAQNTTNNSASSSQSSSGNTQTPSSSDSQNGGFFNQQQNGGYNFGNSGSSQLPGSSSHVS